MITLIAVLVRKKILTEQEAEKLVEHINNKPQSTVLSDATAQISEFIGGEVPKLVQSAERKAKAVAGKVAEKVRDEAQEIAEKVAADASKEDKPAKTKK